VNAAVTHGLYWCSS